MYYPVYAYEAMIIITHRAIGVEAQKQITNKPKYLLILKFFNGIHSELNMREQQILNGVTNNLH